MSLVELEKVMAQLETWTSTAAQYGPFFFSLLFMCVIPTGLVFLYRYLFSSTADQEIKRGLYTDFRIYFHISVSAGVLCTILGAGWWIFSSYRYNELSREAFAELRSSIETLQKEDTLQSYTAIGRIEANTDPYIQFDNVLFEPQIYFTKSPYGPNSWIFLIVSKSPLAGKEIGGVMIRRQTTSMSIPDYLNGKLKLDTNVGIGMYKIEKFGASISIVPDNK